MNVRRQVREGIIHQGSFESISYTLLVTPWGSNPVNPVITLYLYDPDTDTYTDVSATNLVGLPVIAGDVITMPLVTALTNGEQYYLSMQFDILGNTLEAFCKIMCDR